MQILKDRQRNLSESYMHVDEHVPPDYDDVFGNADGGTEINVKEITKLRVTLPQPVAPCSYQPLQSSDQHMRLLKLETSDSESQKMVNSESTTNFETNLPLARINSMVGQAVTVSNTKKEKENTTRVLDKELTDDLLPLIAASFGKNWDIFFIQQKISHAQIDQIKEDNPRNTAKSILETLRVWRDKRRDDGVVPTISYLRTELRKCKSVNVDLEEFDRIAAE